MPGVLGAWLAGAALLAVAGPALAQVTGADRLEPGVASPMTVTLQRECQEVLRIVATDGKAHYEASVQFGVPGMQSAGPHELTIEAAHCAGEPDGKTETSGTWNLTAGTSVPALELIDVGFTFKPVGPSIPAQAVDPIQLKFNVTVLGKPSITMQAPQPNASAGPQNAVPFELVVSNTGNCDATVIFELAESPPEEWGNYILPPALPLGSPNSRVQPTQDTATFWVNTPYENGPNDDNVTFRVRATPYCTIDNNFQGPAKEATLAVESGGMYIPGPGALLVVLVLAGTALGAARNRRA